MKLTKKERADHFVQTHDARFLAEMAIDLEDRANRMAEALRQIAAYDQAPRDAKSLSSLDEPHAACIARDALEKKR